MAPDAPPDRGASPAVRGNRGGVRPLPRPRDRAPATGPRRAARDGKPRPSAVLRQLKRDRDGRAPGGAGPGGAPHGGARPPRQAARADAPRPRRPPPAAHADVPAARGAGGPERQGSARAARRPAARGGRLIAMRVCLMVEGQEDVTWEQWVALA